MRYRLPCRYLTIVASKQPAGTVKVEGGGGGGGAAAVEGASKASSEAESATAGMVFDFDMGSNPDGIVQVVDKSSASDAFDFFGGDGGDEECAT